jgi:hypothetical protein
MVVTTRYGPNVIRKKANVCMALMLNHHHRRPDTELPRAEQPIGARRHQARTSPVNVQGPDGKQAGAMAHRCQTGSLLISRIGERRPLFVFRFRLYWPTFDMVTPKECSVRVPARHGW